MGLWSVDGPVPVPGFLGDYTDTPRRSMRLGHMEFFGLGIINLLLAWELPRFVIGRRVVHGAVHAMNFGNVFLPLLPFAAAIYHSLKYVLPFPAISIFIALCLTAYDMTMRRRGMGA